MNEKEETFALKICQKNSNCKNFFLKAKNCFGENTHP